LGFGHQVILEIWEFGNLTICATQKANPKFGVGFFY
jgi:hypothetical protein